MKLKQLTIHTEKRRNLTLVSHHREKNQIAMSHTPKLNVIKICLNKTCKNKFATLIEASIS